MVESFIRRCYLSAKQKISIQDFVNFAADHPKLVPLMAGLGISVAFGWTGRFFIHEALAAGVLDLPVLDQGNFLPPTFQEGTEIKGLPPVIDDGQFMPFQEASEAKILPPLQEGEFLPPGVIPSKEIPTD